MECRFTLDRIYDMIYTVSCTPLLHGLGGRNNMAELGERWAVNGELHDSPPCGDNKTSEPQQNPPIHTSPPSYIFPSTGACSSHIVSGITSLASLCPIHFGRPSGTSTTLFE